MCRGSEADEAAGEEKQSCYLSGERARGSAGSLLGFARDLHAYDKAAFVDCRVGKGQVPRKRRRHKAPLPNEDEVAPTRKSNSSPRTLLSPDEHPLWVCGVPLCRQA
jgi:hypothetical protein